MSCERDGCERKASWSFETGERLCEPCANEMLLEEHYRHEGDEAMEAERAERFRDCSEGPR